MTLRSRGSAAGERQRLAGRMRADFTRGWNWENVIEASTPVRDPVASGIPRSANRYRRCPPAEHPPPLEASCGPVVDRQSPVAAVMDQTTCQCGTDGCPGDTVTVGRRSCATHPAPNLKSDNRYYVSFQHVEINQYCCGP